MTGVILLLLAYIFWIWWKDGKTWKPFYDRVCRRIRSGIGVVSREEMRALHEHFLQKEQEWERRVTKLEANVRLTNKLKYASKEMEPGLPQIEQFEFPARFTGHVGQVLQPRSIVRLGVRLTLSDLLWDHLGSERVDEIDDHVIDSMVQGPFCPVCLKRIVGRDRHNKRVEVPAQCRSCGISWDSQGTVTFPLSLIDLKRQVYVLLDQEYRAGERIY